MKDRAKTITMAYYGIVALLVFIGLYKIFNHSVEEIDADNSIVDLLLNQSMVFAYLALGLIAVISIIFLVTHFKQSLWTIVGVIVLLVVFGIAWSMSGTGTPEFLESFSKMGLTGNESRMSEAGLRTTFILGAIGIVGAIASGVKGLFE
jgi:hypothetical protein